MNLDSFCAWGKSAFAKIGVDLDVNIFLADDLQKELYVIDFEDDWLVLNIKLVLFNNELFLRDLVCYLVAKRVTDVLMMEFYSKKLENWVKGF